MTIESDSVADFEGLDFGAAVADSPQSDSPQSDISQSGAPRSESQVGESSEWGSPIESWQAPTDLPPRRPAWGDPWPHEHGEDPSGVSIPDGSVGVHHQEHTHLIGAPVVVDDRHGRRPGVVGGVLLVSAMVATGAALATLVL